MGCCSWFLARVCEHANETISGFKETVQSLERITGSSTRYDCNAVINAGRYCIRQFYLNITQRRKRKFNPAASTDDVKKEF